MMTGAERGLAVKLGLQGSSLVVYFFVSALGMDCNILVQYTHTPTVATAWLCEQTYAHITWSWPSGRDVFLVVVSTIQFLLLSDPHHSVV